MSMQIPGPSPKISLPLKPATLDDIARVAGVHPRTVRDALQGTGRVASATRENVQRIAQELQYEPNLLARALSKGKTGRISVLLGSLNEPYNATAAQHLVDVITHHGYEAMIIQAYVNMPSIQTLRSSFSDGIIVVGLQFFDADAKSSGVMRDHIGPPISPCVVIDSGRPDYLDHITLNLGPAVKEGLQMMVESGRRRIAYIHKHAIEPEYGELRFRTYMDLVGAAGLEPEIIVADEQEGLAEHIPSVRRIKQLKTYFEQHGAPGAIFCHNDEIAIFTYRALRSLGYDVPNDSLLLGCDGINYMDCFDPPLSTVALNWEEIGEKACQFLKQRIEEPDIPVQEHIVKGKLVVRESLVAKG